MARWKASCQKTLNAGHNTDDVLSFTSTALLALAFARLHVDLGPCRRLFTRDPSKIAAALLSAPAPVCNPEAVPALLHAAHALSVPVQMGVDHASSHQAWFRHYEFAICGLESAIFLWRWLQSAGESMAWEDLNGRFREYRSLERYHRH